MRMKTGSLKGTMLRRHHRRVRVIKKATHKANQSLLTLMNRLYWGKGLPLSRKNALALAKILANAGEFAAARLLGASYDWGVGVRRDTKQALKYWCIGADLGDVYCQVNLAYAYDTGLGTPKDKKKAIRWYRRAADAGNVDAKLNLEALMRRRNADRGS